MKKLEQESQQLSAALTDKEEWKVKIYVDLKRRKYYISKPGPDTKERTLIQDELNKKLNEYKEKSFGWMSKQALRAKLNGISPKESMQKKRTIILNSTYLVSKENREDFSRVVRCLGEEYKRKGLEFKCTGPKPFYDFFEGEEK
jgi:hypothetical protein